MLRRRTILLSVASFAVLLLLGVALGFPPFVRSKASSQAARYGASISIGSVRPALFGASLSNVDISFADIPALLIHFDRVRVSSNGNADASGGRIELRADRQTVLSQIEKWRASRPKSDSPSASTSSRIVSLHDLNLTWPGFDGDGTELLASGLNVDDLLHGDHAHLGTVRAVSPLGELDAAGLDLAWSQPPSPLAKKLTAASIKASVKLPVPVPEPDPPQAPTPRLTPKPATPTPASTPIRDKLATYATAISSRLTPDAQLRVDAFEVHVERGKDSATVGPGSLIVERKESNLTVDLSPGASAGAAGITFRAVVPLGAGPVLVDVNGGPITLATLGLRERDLGLIHPDKAQLRVNAHFELNADGRSLVFNGNFKASGVSISHDKLADAPVEGLSLAARMKGGALLDGSHLHLEDSEIDVGSLQFNVSGLFERDTERRIRVDAKFGIPLVPCQEALDSLPETLVPIVHGMRVAGTLSLTGKLRFDPSRPKDFQFDYRTSNDCRFTSVPPNVDVQRFKQAFKRTVYGPDNKKVEIDSGPGTPGWTPIGGVSQNMEMAVLSTEDARFRIHHGFDHEAIHNSVRENLIKGAFVRGASTLSMQLAKNLYLERKKTVSRKLQELILTMYLEQVLTKEQILELYFNVVEFGPMLYGIGPASAHYFRCAPSELTPGQALYLSSILPQPKTQHFASGGRLSEGWMKYIWKLIKNAEKRSWLTPEDAQSALDEWVVFGGPPIRGESGNGKSVSPDGEASAPGPAD
ncbi:MAG: transglycosylase domain-containing protein [Deltaproteobacteria bacterium]|nr:transglycosylase domain-containing protein [Deltaproteobacteria bacterium]